MRKTKMQVLVCLLVLSYYVRSQQVDEDVSYTVSQLAGLRTLCKPHCELPSTSPSCVRCQPQPGKRGPKGEVGETGERGVPGEDGGQGPPGYVDQTLLDAQKVRLDSQQTLLNAQQTEVTALKAKVEELEETIATIRCENGIFYGNSCFFVLDRKYAFDDAQRACGEVNAHLAYIDSARVYDAVKPHLQRIISAGSTMHFLFGASFDATSAGQRIRFLNGRSVAWTHEWRSGYPTSDPTWTAMMWQVWKTPSSEGGFWNYLPTSARRPICQKDV